MKKFSYMVRIVLTVSELERVLNEAGDAGFRMVEFKNDPANGRSLVILEREMDFK